MNPKMHKLFLTHCDMEESRQVSASDCQRCPRGSVVDERSMVICCGVVKFFVTPCFYDLRASASVKDCLKCRFGTVVEDRLRVLCDRL
jgi:hypothetical protein